MRTRVVAWAACLAVCACSSSSPPPALPDNNAADKSTGGDGDAAAWVSEGNAKLVLGGSENHRQAAALFRRACDSGRAEGCTALGYVVRDGYTGEAVAASFEWFSRGCELGDAGACGAAGAHLFLNDQRARGVALLRKSCDKGNGRGCMILSGVLPEGNEAATAIARSIELLEEGCKSTARFCAHLGDAYRSGIGVARDLDRALVYYKKGCELEDGRSCVVVGQYHLAEAAGSESSKSTAAEMFARACGLGHGDGCAFAGMVVIGDDSDAAGKKFLQGCELGSGRGCVLAAGHSGIEPGLAREELHRKGCQLRYPPGCLLAGTGYLQGVGDEVAADAVKALEHFETGCVELRPVCEDGACREGVRDSCHNAATMYAIGMGTKADPATARDRYQAACDLGGNEQACHNAKDL